MQRLHPSMSRDDLITALEINNRRIEQFIGETSKLVGTLYPVGAIWFGDDLPETLSLIGEWEEETSDYADNAWRRTS